MMRSLYSGVSGLKNHQTRMDVIGNNIANVNTAGFKSSRVVFQDVFSQTSKYASAANGSGVTATVGGTNAIQIGLGMTLSAVDILHNPAATSRSDNPTDLAIEGDGFFIVKSPNGETLYTRAGNLYMDNEGNLVTGNGGLLQGVMGATPPGVNPTLATLNVKGYTGISIDSSGMISGLDSDGDKHTLGYIMLATFTNNSGLETKGNSLFAASSNSGAAVVSQPQKSGAGKINTGGLEMSNVDLASEFTDMIVTQRGFQACSRVVTTTDAMLEELVNLKR